MKISADRTEMVAHLNELADEHWVAARKFSPRGSRAANERGIAAGLEQAARIIGDWEEAGEIKVREWPGLNP